MKLNELANLLDAEIGNAGDAGKEIRGGYTGDFLSFVMSRAPSDCAWFTVMSNVNVAAVAYMSEVGCVVICEGVNPEQALVERCKKENINLLTTALDSYRAAAKLAVYESKL